MVRYAFGLLFFAFLTAPLAAQPAPWEVFSALAPSAPTEEAVAARGELERFEATLDAAFSETSVQVGDQVRMALPEGARTFRVQRVQTYMPGSWSVSALAEDGSADVAALTFAHGSALGIVTSGDDLFHVTVGESGTAILQRMDARHLDEIECGYDHDHARPSTTPWTGSVGAGRAALDHAQQHATPAVTMPGLVDTLDDEITMDVLILYTPNAEAWAGQSSFGSIEAIISQAMNLSQLALDNSETGAVLRLVHTTPIDYDDNLQPPPGTTGGPSVWHLYRLTANDDTGFNPWGDGAAGFMQEAHALRDEYGADLVTLFAEISDVGGIAWLLNTIGGLPNYGFSVNRVQQMATSFTLVHEFGHNWGSAHGRDQASNAAGPNGGIFEYSTGWRFVGDNPYSTVMSYGRTGDQRVAHFSNPNVLLDGVPTGAMTGPFAPADAARTIREVKRTVASYRPTLVDPPSPSVSVPSLEIELAGETPVTRTLTISNTSGADLVWDLELAAAAPPARPASGLEVAHDEHGQPERVASAGNVSPGDVLALAANRDLLTIYQTAFGSEDGFEPGAHGVIGGWSTNSTAAPVGISTANPSEGAQHLRLPASVPVSLPNNAATNFYSTYFGPWPGGRYELSFDFSVTEFGESTYFILFQDSRGGQIVAGLRLDGEGDIATYDPEETVDTGLTWEPGSYIQASMLFEPETNTVTYFFDGEPVVTRPMAPGTAPGRIWVQRSASTTTDQLDLDRITYRSPYRGLSWASADRSGGVVPAGQQQTVTLDFSAEDLEPGTYQAEVVVRTNEEGSTPLVFPVTATVLPVSEEGAPDEPVATRLVGSYPTPTSGPTRIVYELATASPVELTVYTVTGQRVATLVEAYQSAGRHSFDFDTAALANGIYIYRLRTQDAVDARRLTVLR